MAVGSAVLTRSNKEIPSDSILYAPAQSVGMSAWTYRVMAAGESFLMSRFV